MPPMNLFKMIKFMEKIYKIGNKTLCDICSSKAMKKARAKKEHKETATPSVEGDHLEETTPPPTPPPIIEEGITVVKNPFKITFNITF